MIRLDSLRSLNDPASPEPVQALMDLSKTLQGPGETVEKRPTPDTTPIHEVEFDVPTGPVAAIMPPERDLEVIAKLRGYGARPSGKRLVLELGGAGRVTYTPQAGEWVGKTERGRLLVETEDPEDTLQRLGFGR